jgi:hypothetical protein
MAKTPSAAPTDSLTFTAALAQFGRKALTLDADGECILALQIPASDAAVLTGNYQQLLNRTFDVTLRLT